MCYLPLSIVFIWGDVEKKILPSKRVIAIGSHPNQLDETFGY